MRLIFLFVFTSALICRAEDKASGRWEGAVQVPGSELQTIINLAKDGGRPWRGSITIPGLNITGEPLVDIAVQDSDVSFGIKTGCGL